MRASKVGSLIGIGVTALAVAPMPVQAAKASKPNIIFVLADDLGYGDLNCYGGKGAQTKNIDSLAREGIRFTQFYVNSPICSPSRTAFTTGQYPARWRITSFINNRAANENRGMAQWLDLSAPTLARSLSEAGYITGHFGKWHMGGGRDVGEAPLPTEYGFNESLTQFEGLGDRVLPLLSTDGKPPEKKVGLGVASEKLGRGKVTWMKRPEVTKTFVNRALSFIEQANKAGKPFYLNLWPDDVHSPFDPPANLRGNGSKKALYNGVLTNMDTQLGPLFDAIRQNSKLRNNTLIIFASDNGPEPGAGSAGHFRGGKATLYEGGIREPFIVWGPGLIDVSKRGTVNNTAVFSGVDLLPSVLGLTGETAKTPKGDGTDLSATLIGKQSTGRTLPLFWKRPPGREGTRKEPLPFLAVRDGNWKLLIDDNGGNAQLYNLADDERETKNLASANPQVVERLKKLVLDWNRTLPSSKPKTPSSFTLKNGDQLGRDEAPAIEDQAFTINTKFNSKAARGVIVAQGGVANGYSLYIDEKGALVFLVRQNKQLYSAAIPDLNDGEHSAVARLDDDGTLSLAADGGKPVQSKAAGLFTQTPLDGLDVGSDQGGLVGPYPDASRFTGTIESVTVELEAAE